MSSSEFAAKPQDAAVRSSTGPGRIEPSPASMSSSGLTMAFRDRSRVWEYAAVAALSLIASGALYAYIKDFALLGRWQATVAANAVASATEVVNEVRFKRSSVVFWSAAASGEALNAGDQVFTDRDSEAALRFADGTVIRIGENSLVRIETRDDRSQLNLIRGEVLEAKIEPEDKAGGGPDRKPFAIRIGALEVDLAAGTEFKARQDVGQGPQLIIESGEASIENPAPASQIVKSEAAVIDAGPQAKETAPAKVQTLVVRPTEPQQGAVIRGFGETKVRLAWESSQAGPFLVEISRDRAFVDAVVSMESESNSVDHRLLEPGTYFWRVAARNDFNEWEPAPVTRRFKFSPFQAVQVIWPPGRHTIQGIEAESEGHRLTFSWTQQEQLPVEIMLSRGGAFGADALSRIFKEKRHFRVRLKPGSYVWRLRAIDPVTGMPGPWSAQGSIAYPEPKPLSLGAKQALTAAFPPDSLVRGSDIAAADRPSAAPSATSDDLNRLLTDPAKNTMRAAFERSDAIDPPPQQVENGAQALSARAKSGMSAESSRDGGGGLALYAAATPPRLPTAPSMTDSMAIRFREARKAVKKIVVPAGLASPSVHSKLPEQALDFGSGVPMTIKWSKVEGAESYDVEIGGTDGFAKLEHATNTAALGLKKLLPAGTYSVRVRAVAPAARGPWSDAIHPAIRAWQPLAAPEVDLGQNMILYRNSPGRIRVAMRSSAAPASFILQAAADPLPWSSGAGNGGKQAGIMEMRVRADAAALSPFTPDTFIRVSAVDEFGRLGLWSEPQKVSLQKVEDMPELESPAEGAVIRFPYLDKKLVRFAWTQPPDVVEHNLLVARDEAFTDIAHSARSRQPAGEALLDKEATYYWRVQQLTALENMTIESPTRRFTTVTLPLPPVDRSRLPHELYAGYGLSLLGYSFETDDTENLIEDSWANSIFASYSYWITTGWGFELDLTGHVLSIASVDRDKGTTSRNTLTFLDFSLLTRVLWELSEDQGLRLEGLFGLSANTLAKIVTGSEALDVRTYQPIHLWNGVGLLYAITPSVFFNPRIEAGIPLHLDNADMESGVYVRAILRALQRLPRWNANIAYGLLGEYKNYELTKDSRKEKIRSDLKGLMLGLGKDF